MAAGEIAELSPGAIVSAGFYCHRVEWNGREKEDGNLLKETQVWGFLLKQSNWIPAKERPDLELGHENWEMRSLIDRMPPVVDHKERNH